MQCSDENYFAGSRSYSNKCVVTRRQAQGYVVIFVSSSLWLIARLANGWWFWKKDQGN